MVYFKANLLKQLELPSTNISTSLSGEVGHNPEPCCPGDRLGDRTRIGQGYIGQSYWLLVGSWQGSGIG